MSTSCLLPLRLNVASMRHGCTRVALCTAACLVVFLFLALAPRCPAVFLNQLSLQPNAPVEITVDSFHESLPPVGFAPISVTLRNRTAREHTFHLSYRINASESNVSGAATLHVLPNGRSQNILFIPVIRSFDYSWGNLELNLSGPGIGTGEITLRGRNNYKEAFVGMGHELAYKHWGEIEKEMAKKSYSFHGGGGLGGTKIIPSSAPADWRAYTGFSSLWFSHKEWYVLDPGARAAVEEWIALGGNLYLVCDTRDQFNTLKVPGESRFKNWEHDDFLQVSTLAFGKIYYLASNTFDEAMSAKEKKEGRRKKNFEQTVIKVCETQGFTFAKLGKDYALNQSNGRSWELLNQVAKYEHSLSLSTIFFFLFAIVVGPLNFFVFAPSRRRYRILWTTPLIALGASFLLLLFILFRDGTRGVGARVTIAYLAPMQKRLVIRQEQVSRTGLLWGNKFSLEDGAMMLPIKLPKWISNKLSFSYFKTRNGWAGDWFGTRGIQAQYLQTSRPAHSGIRVTLPKADKPGTIISSLDFELEKLYLVSPDGRTIYETDGLVPGVQRPLVQAHSDSNSAKTKMRNAWSNYVRHAGEAVFPLGPDSQVGRAQFEGQNGFFYAKVKKPEELAIATLDVVSWHEDSALVVGPAEFAD